MKTLNVPDKIRRLGSDQTPLGMLRVKKILSRALVNHKRVAYKRRVYGLMQNIEEPVPL